MINFIDENNFTIKAVLGAGVVIPLPIIDRSKSRSCANDLNKILR
jgi:hypothetical protein